MIAMKKRNLKKRVTSLLCTTLIAAGITGGIAAGSSIYVQADTIDELFQQREDLTKQEKEKKLDDYKKELDGLNFKMAEYTLGNNIQIVSHATRYNDHMLVVNEQIRTNAIILQMKTYVIYK